jgi:hypothetical protein
MQNVDIRTYFPDVGIFKGEKMTKDLNSDLQRLWEENTLEELKGKSHEELLETLRESHLKHDWLETEQNAKEEEESERY